jgi:hypothetical protein
MIKGNTPSSTQLGQMMPCIYVIDDDRSVRDALNPNWICELERAQTGHGHAPPCSRGSSFGLRQKYDCHDAALDEGEQDQAEHDGQTAPDQRLGPRGNVQ